MKKEKGLGAWLLIALAALFLCAMLVLPLVLVVHEALARGAAAYLSAVTEPFAVKALQLTLLATAVAVGTATFTDPSTAARVCDGIAAYCERQGFAAARDVTGALAS